MDKVPQSDQLIRIDRIGGIGRPLIGVPEFENFHFGPIIFQSR
jgi:hypothetical protein